MTYLEEAIAPRQADKRPGEPPPRGAALRLRQARRRRLEAAEGEGDRADVQGRRDAPSGVRTAGWPRRGGEGDPRGRREGRW